MSGVNYFNWTIPFQYNNINRIALAFSGFKIESYDQICFFANITNLIPTPTIYTMYFKAWSNTTFLYAMFNILITTPATNDYLDLIVGGNLIINNRLYFFAWPSYT